MLVPCSRCATPLRVPDDTLDDPAAMVRCTRCQHVGPVARPSRERTPPPAAAEPAPLLEATTPDEEKTRIGVPMELLAMSRAEAGTEATRVMQADVAALMRQSAPGAASAAPRPPAPGSRTPLPFVPPVSLEPKDGRGGALPRSGAALPQDPRSLAATLFEAGEERPSARAASASAVPPTGPQARAVAPRRLAVPDQSVRSAARRPESSSRGLARSFRVGLALLALAAAALMLLRR